MIYHNLAYMTLFSQKLLMNKKLAVLQEIQDKLRKIKEIKHSTRFNKVSGIDSALKQIFISVLSFYCLSVHKII